MKAKDLLKNLDSFRPTRFRVPDKITKEQREFLIKARKGDYPISYCKIAELWMKVGWGKVTEYNIRDIVRKFKLCDK